MARLASAMVIASAVLVAGCSSNTTGQLKSPPSERIRLLLDTINDKPNALHFERTPAGEELIALGTEAVPHVVPLLASDSEVTRLHANHVLRRITASLFGWRTVEGYPDNASEDRHNALWKSLGDLRSDSTAEEGRAAAPLWQKWIAAGFPTS